MKKKQYLAVATLAAATLMTGSAFAGVMTTVTRSVSAELVASQGTSGIDTTNTSVVGTSTMASAIYELGTGQSFSVGSKFTITLTNAQFAASSGLYICSGTSQIASGTVTTSAPSSIELTASAVVPAYTAYQLYSGTSSACGTTSAVISLPVKITGTSPTTIQADSTDVPAASASAVTLYNTRNQFSASLTSPRTAVINFATTPPSTAFIANPTVMPATTTSSFGTPFTVFSDETILIKQQTGLADNTSCGASSTSFTLNVPVTVTGTFTELAATSGTSAVPTVVSVGSSGPSYTTTMSVSSTSTSATTGTSLTGSNFALCGSGALASTVASTSATNPVPALLLTKISNTSVSLIPRTFNTKVEIGNGTSVIRTLLDSTLSHTIQLNTTKYVAPYIKYSSDGVNQTYFKMMLKRSNFASTALVIVNMIDATGVSRTISLPSKTLTAGAMQTLTGGEIVAAIQAAGYTVPSPSAGMYQFAGSIEIASTEDNLNVYALNGSGTSFTRIPLRVNPDSFYGTTHHYVQ